MTAPAGNLVGSAFNSVSAFIPQIYPLQFIRKTYMGSVTQYITNQNWSGEIAGPGSVLNLRQVPDVLVNASTADGSVNWQNIQATSQTFTINYGFDGAFIILDRERSQFDVNAEGACINDMLNRLRIEREKVILSGAYAYAANTVTAATGTTAWGYQNTTTGNTKSIDHVNTAYSYLDTGPGDGTYVTPPEDRYLVMHPNMRPALAGCPAFYALNAGTPKGALYDGFVSQVAGVNVLTSVFVPGAGTTASPYQAMVGHPEAITMGTKYTEVKSNILLQDYHGYGTRCQNFFGYLVTIPYFLVNISTVLT
jgi:hypothetical protein